MEQINSVLQGDKLAEEVTWEVYGRIKTPDSAEEPEIQWKNKLRYILCYLVWWKTNKQKSLLNTQYQTNIKIRSTF